jgi:hypothetical protein
VAVRSIAIMVCAVAFSLGLTGCYGPRLDIPRSALDLPACPVSSEPYSVTTLGNEPRAQCDLSGREILFPDGFTLAAPEIGSSRSASDGEHSATHTLFNFGTFGLVAAQTPEYSENTKWWGTKDGLKRYWDAFGKVDPGLLQTTKPQTDRVSAFVRIVSTFKFHISPLTS